MKSLIHFCWLETHAYPNHISPRERIKKIRKIENLKCVHKNKLYEACFPHDATYADNKDLAGKKFQKRLWKKYTY